MVSSPGLALCGQCSLSAGERGRGAKRGTDYWSIRDKLEGEGLAPLELGLGISWPSGS